MKFSVTRTSEMFNREEKFIQIDTLEELLKFVKEADHAVIISLGDEPELEIYDDYRE